MHRHDDCEQVMAIIDGSVDMTIEGTRRPWSPVTFAWSNRGLDHELLSAGGVHVFEALGPVPLDHVPDRERDLVLGRTTVRARRR